MSLGPEAFQVLIQTIATQLENEETPQPEAYNAFLEKPRLVNDLITYMNTLPDEYANNSAALYSACIFLLDISVTQLNTLGENGNKSAQKLLTQIMNYMAEIINQHQHSIGFWLPALNAFYDTHTELSPTLKDAYFDLACQDDEEEEGDSAEKAEQEHLTSMETLLNDMHDLSAFDIADNFLAQSYAMPPDFFPDLLVDLYDVEIGADAGLLLLLHPNHQVRDLVVHTLNAILEHVTLSSVSLSRLQTIMHWYPEKYRLMFMRWIKHQRKKGVVFMPESDKPQVIIKATEMDGSGSQGIFLHIRQHRKHRLCGLLYKYTLGIKDAWTTGLIPAKEVKNYYGEALEDNVTLRVVSEDYFIMMTEHFLAETMEKGHVPDLHLLEIQEMLGIQLRPKKLDVDFLVDSIAIQITPFTQRAMQESFTRSAKWYKTRQFTDSWFLENADIDKLVNACCNFVDGVKVCRIDDAMQAVFQYMEKHRSVWLFHFLWAALWSKSGSTKREKTWEDCFFIAYAIREGQPFESLPIMQAICRTTVANSVETMHERGTYLN